jgi:hypothetical protein
VKTTVIAHCAQRQLQILSSLLEGSPNRRRQPQALHGPDPDGEI